MTTQANDPPTAASDSNPGQQERDFGPIETLRDLLELGGRLAAEIPEEERKASRAVMVAYLDEVAAREPSRRPDEQVE